MLGQNPKEEWDWSPRMAEGEHLVISPADRLSGQGERPKAGVTDHWGGLPCPPPPPPPDSGTTHSTIRSELQNYSIRKPKPPL